MTLELLVLSLPTANATARMRCWRALKALGAAVLRDGVYALPSSPAHRAALAEVAADVRSHEGSAQLLATQSDEPLDLHSLFDRSAEYSQWLTDARSLSASLGTLQTSAAERDGRRLNKLLEHIVAIDFFPGPAREEAQAAWAALNARINALVSPGEPLAQAQAIERLDAADFQGRLWATRERPWVDRLASAWLIRRWIDQEARFLWLKTPADCPPDALGFDFDGARFSHVGERVSFETLMASFGLETPPLKRLAALVHGLDVGGTLVPEAAGVERVLAGMREALTDDDQLFAVAAGVFEGLHIAFQKEAEL